MSAYVREAARPLVEPVPVPLIYSDGLAEVIIANDRVTYVHYVEQPTYCVSGRPVMERVIVAKVTVPLASVEMNRAITRKAWAEDARAAAQRGKLSDGPGPIGETRGNC